MNTNDDNGGGTMVTGNATRYAQLLAQRGALKCEVMGMKRSGRSVLSIIRGLELELTDPETGKLIETIKVTDKRTARGAYADLNAVIVRLMGPEFDRPLPSKS